MNKLSTSILLTITLIFGMVFNAQFAFAGVSTKRLSQEPSEASSNVYQIIHDELPTDASNEERDAAGVTDDANKTANTVATSTNRYLSGAAGNPTAGIIIIVPTFVGPIPRNN